ncbi:MAG TPA: hypothetical protein VF517_10725 [Thermoleophilaceae bacterium]|jgi:hypothetical protein
MRPALALLLAAVVSVALLAAPAGATHSRGKCTQRGKTLIRNDSGRLFEKDNVGGGLTLLGCLWSANRTVVLDTAYSDFTTDHTYGQERLAGRYAAWATSTEDVSCKAECPADYPTVRFGVHVMNLRTRAERTVEGIPAGSAFKLNADGVTAWLARLGNGQREVHLWTAKSHDVVGSGAVPSSSLRLTRDTLSWVDGDVQHTVRLP